MLKDSESNRLPFTTSAEEKYSSMSSKMCTQLTTNLESMSLDHQDPLNGTEVRDKQGFLSKKFDIIASPIIETEHNQQESNEESIFSKFEELEERSSKLLNLLPPFQSRVKQQSVQSPLLLSKARPGESEQRKLRIIKDLECKIFQLESNINNPQACKQEMKSIKKSINQTFDHYYAHNKESLLKEADNNDQAQTVAFSPIQKRTHKKLFPLEPPMAKKQTSFSYEICVLVPKIIEIQIPVPVLKVVQIQEKHQVNQSISLDEEKPLRKSKSYSEDNSSGTDGSIGQIIKQYTKRISYGPTKMQEKQEYEDEAPSIVVSIKDLDAEDPSSFNLPLDSCEKINISEVSNKKKSEKPGRTDRSNISSISEIDKMRDEIWNRECLEFNQEHLAQVNQRQGKSESNFDERSQEANYPYKDKENPQVVQQLSQLSQVVLKLREELAQKDRQLEQSRKLCQEFETKAVDKEIQYLQLVQKHEVMELEHIQLHSQIQKYRTEVIEQESLQLSLNNRIKDFEDRLMTLSEEKQNQEHDYLKAIQEKIEEIEQLCKVNQELKQVFKVKEQNFESQVLQFENQLNVTREELKYYRTKIAEDGLLNINTEDVNMIKQMIEEKEDSQKLQLHQRYRQKIESLKQDYQEALKCIVELKADKKRLADRFSVLGADQEWFQQEFGHIMKEYHQTEIAFLTSQKETFQQSQDKTSTSSCQKEINIIDSILNYTLSQKNKSEDHHALPFIFAVQKVLNRLKFCEKSLSKEQQQRERLSNKLKGLNLAVNRQIEKAQQKAEKLSKQNSKVKHQNQELNTQLRRSQAKIIQMKHQFSDNSKIISSTHQMEKQFLEKQNKKLLQKWRKEKNYSEELEHQILKQSSELLAGRSQFNYQTFNPSFSKIKKIGLASSVVSYAAKPGSKITLPKKIMAPLPVIPSMQDLPQSLPLDKLFMRRTWWTPKIKQTFSIKLIDLCVELIKVSRKLFSLKPVQMVVSGLKGDIQIIIKREFGNSSEQDENSLLYRAPEVLLGFAESEASYVWSVGIIIDQIWHEKPFYAKLSQILSVKNNFQVRNHELPIKDLLERILRKNQKDRPSLQQVKQELLTLG